jgi:hypothetical protein
MAITSPWSLLTYDGTSRNGTKITGGKKIIKGKKIQEPGRDEVYFSKFFYQGNIFLSPSSELNEQ